MDSRVPSLNHHILHVASFRFLPPVYPGLILRKTSGAQGLVPSFQRLTIPDERTGVLDMGDVVRIAEPTLAAKLLGWVAASRFDRAGLLPPVTPLQLFCARRSLNLTTSQTQVPLSRARDREHQKRWSDSQMKRHNRSLLSGPFVESTTVGTGQVVARILRPRCQLKDQLRWRVICCAAFSWVGPSLAWSLAD